MKSAVKFCPLFKLSRRPFIIKLADQLKKIFSGLPWLRFIWLHYDFIMMHLCSNLQLTAKLKGSQTQAKKKGVKNNLGKEDADRPRSMKMESVNMLLFY